MKEGLGVPLVIVATCLVLAVLIFVATKQDDEWRAWCQSQGGHVTSTTKTDIVFVDGKSGTSSSTTYFCLTADGRVLDVR